MKKQPAVQPFTALLAEGKPPGNPERERAHRFVRATSLQRGALARLRVEDIHLHDDDLTVIDVNDRDGVPIFEVPVLPRHTHVVLSAIAGRDPEALVFPQLPRALSLQPFRVQYARELYRYALAHNDVGYDEENCVEYVLDALCLQQRHLELVRGYFLGLCQARKSR